MRAKMSRRRFVAGSITLAAASSLAPLGPIATAAQGRLGITAAERRTLRATANVLIPAEGRMPVASAVGVVSYVETIAAKNRKVHELLVGGLRAIESAAGRPRLDGLTADQQLAVLSRIEKTDSPAGFFPLLRDLVYEAYCTHPRVMKLVGYRFRSGRRRTAALEPFDEARLVRVRAMKPLYRDVRP